MQSAKAEPQPRAEPAASMQKDRISSQTRQAAQQAQKKDYNKAASGANRQIGPPGARPERS